MGLHTHVAQPQFWMLEVVVVEQALGLLSSRVGATVRVLPQPIGHARFDRGQKRDAALRSLRRLLAKCFQGGFLLIDIRTVEVHQRNPFGFCEGFGLLAQLIRQVFAVAHEIDIADLLPKEKGIDALVVAEQHRLGAKTQPIKTRQNKLDEGSETS